ncbi:MAG TPA: S16 family serine protease [Candidatus Norongarragalinales archaeon]|nr:S16 family serine protease [Candidatus Norongarragalinales archaeon]
MKNTDGNFLFIGGIFLLGLLAGLLIYENVFPPKLVERIYSEGDNGSITVTTRPLSFTEIYNSKIPVLAVKSDDNTGVVSYANVEIRSGKGRVLINTNPFVEPDTQYSAETAVKIAQKLLGVDLSDRDIILTFEANTSLVGGPSAGGAITIATLAAIQNIKPNPDVIMTGTIEEDGTIGQVGGVLEKAQAAAKNGAKIFLVPSGSSNMVYYERQVRERRFGGFVIQEVNYVPKTLNLAEYAMEKWKIEVKEVGDISQAREYFGV